ncbi:MAG: hypothetical protein MK135_02580 [Polyangiaceae bacterium]|nr:hypothetical protein [Polyangiaceae bacterium]
MADPSPLPGIARKPLSLQTTIITMIVIAPGTFAVTARPTTPQFLPVPLNQGKLKQRFNKDLKLARQAQAKSLPTNIRALGEEIRRFNYSPPQQKRAHLDAIEALVQDALLKKRIPELLQLRALQSQLFLQALHKWQVPQEPSVELLELGGKFSLVAQQSWRTAEGKWLATDAQLTSLFHEQWARTTGLRTRKTFQLSPQEAIDHYSFLLQLPPGFLSTLQVELAPLRLSYIDQIGKNDPRYPRLFARGIVLLQANDTIGATNALEAYLKTSDHPDYEILAMNFLTSAKNSSQGRFAL